MFAAVKAFLSPYLAQIAAIGAGLLALFVYGHSKKRQGRKEKESEDRKEISEAVKRQRQSERAIRANPDDDRLRDDRDRLSKLLRLSKPNNSK